MSPLSPNTNGREIHQRLARLLQQLKFSDIRVASNSEDKSPSPLPISNDEFFHPCITARKNGFLYVFKTITKNILEDKQQIQKLKKTDELKDEEGNIQLVYVIPYGSKDEIQQIAQHRNLPFDDIWEISVY